MRALAVTGAAFLLLASPPFSGWALAQDPASPSALDPTKQIRHYAHDIWTADDGLPSSTVLDIVQTSDGYLWLATSRGLARFDGVRFTTFDVANTPAFRSNTIGALLKSSDGALWIAARGGGLVRYVGGRFTAYTTADGLTSNDVDRLAEDDTGSLWIVAGGRLQTFRDDAFATFEMPDDLEAMEVRDVVADRDGDLWFTGDGLFRLRNGALDRFTAVDGLRGMLTALLADRAGDVWVTGFGRGLNRFAGGRASVYRIGEGDAARLTPLLEDRAGTLWVGGNSGLHRISNDVFESFTEDDGLSDARVRSIYEDQEGNLWVGTYNGLNRFKDGPITSLSSADGLLPGQTRAIVQDRQGDLWVGSSAGLNRRMSGRWTNHHPGGDANPRGVFQLTTDQSGDVWAGTPIGLFRYSTRGTRHYTTADGLTDNGISVAFVSPKDVLWVVTVKGGLNTLHRFTDGRFASAAPAIPGRIAWLHEDRNGTLWLGAEGGLYRLEGGRVVPVHESVAGGMVTQSIHEDDDGVLWIGTDGTGLLRVWGSEIAVLNSRDGLDSDTIWAILEDDDRNLWMSSDHGISALNRDDIAAYVAGTTSLLEPVVYGRDEGLKTIEGSGLGDPSAHRLDDGTLAFAVVDGLAVVDPQWKPPTVEDPPLVIEEVLVNSTPLTLEADARLDPDQREIEFRYTASVFRDPEAVRFRYRLLGQDEDWIETGNQRVAHYTNLAPGPYEFQVEADAGSGEWSGRGAILAFSVVPYFHETWWFRLLGLLLLAGVVGLSYRARIRGAQARSEVLEREMAERQATQDELDRHRREHADVSRLATVSVLSASLAHELNQPLTAIVSSAQSALRFSTGDVADPDEVLDALTDIEHEGKRAGEIIQRLRALFKEGRGRRERLDMNSVVQESLPFIHAETGKRDIDVQLDLGPGLPSIAGDQMQLEQVLLNLVSNACEAMHEEPGHGHRLTLRTSTGENDTVEVSIQDTGVGISAEVAERLFSPFVTTKTHGMGIGLTICQAIIENHGGRIWTSSNAERGSTLHFALPARR